MDPINSIALDVILEEVRKWDDPFEIKARILSPYDDCPIFIQLSEEMSPGWFWPLETIDVGNGVLEADLSFLYNLRRPLWVTR